MMHLDRHRAAELGRETVHILRTGAYVAPSGRRVDVRPAADAARAATVEYPPERVVAPPAGRGPKTSIAVVNETVLAVGRRMAASGPVAALNFASAISPGGGFLFGAVAQEEAIARSSGLFLALEPCAMYAYHLERDDPMYSDYVIHSPLVPVFRADAGDLLDEPWALTIVTCPAVNGRDVTRHAPGRLPEIPTAMTKRTHKMLAVAAAHGVRRFILGAWGCGAFGLDATMMAGIFRDALDGPFGGVFDEVVFAVFDRSDDGRVIHPFEEVFANR